MGEIARVDLEELRSLADRVTAAAGVVTELRPTALGDGLTGSAAAAAVAGQPLGDRVADVAQPPLLRTAKLHPARNGTVVHVQAGNHSLG